MQRKTICHCRAHHRRIDDRLPLPILLQLKKGNEQQGVLHDKLYFIGRPCLRSVFSNGFEFMDTCGSRRHFY
jgi:hypothetical protein